MKTCKQCERELTDYSNGIAFGNPYICWNCAVERADAKGCTHDTEWCECAADPELTDEEKLTDFLRKNLAVVVEVEEADTDGWYNSNDKLRITVNLTLHGEVISHDTAAIRKL
jgi:hypothetical protein